jgi:hypothetical protein
MKPPDKDGFYTVMALDDWGYVQYFLGGSLSSSGTASNRDQDPAMLLKNGDKVKVKWPDGKVSNEIVCIRKYDNTVHDMGHKYTVEAEFGFVKAKVRGTAVEIDINGLKMKRR